MVRALTQKVGNKTLRFRYCYNSSGAVTKVGNNFEQTVGEYTYDDLGRLVKEVDQKGNKSEWGYDTNGNILFKKHTGTKAKNIASASNCCTSAGASSGCCASGNVTIKEYVYDNNERLVSLVSHSERSEESSVSENFVYDALGNPTTYRDNTLTWTHLRNLASVQTPSGLVTFEYNNQNLRRRRIVQNQRIDYTWSNGKMISETHSIITGPNHIVINPSFITATLDYIYGIDETPMGFTLTSGQGSNATQHTFYYIKNLQGDVVQVIGTSGQVVAEYAYDAWGNFEITQNVNDIANLNPIRYRSYYYDNETNLYYLKSRYYDSDTGRFINADAIEILQATKYDTNGLNLFMYCNNDPINHVDHSGFIPVNTNLLRNLTNSSLLTRSMSASRSRNVYHRVVNKQDIESENHNVLFRFRNISSQDVYKNVNSQRRGFYKVVNSGIFGSGIGVGYKGRFFGFEAGIGLDLSGYWKVSAGNISLGLMGGGYGWGFHLGWTRDGTAYAIEFELSWFSTGLAVFAVGAVLLAAGVGLPILAVGGVILGLSIVLPIAIDIITNPQQGVPAVVNTVRSTVNTATNLARNVASNIPVIGRLFR